ncbi:7-cyano-7-deazaguanine synthase QueC [Tibeticola sp.]|uniref:7-cyano-7-deazaguanine synthase QueC n=1 Tax=Tibeticola sp. TaxID=2005368 RepID=UPI0025DE930E|nr:7-cyano-7-deazaguanine synthase QueC [Tibeticola sp.]
MTSKQGFHKALVLFSGGQDSTTCLAQALEQFEQVETVGFDYGQRHRVELEARQTVLARLRERFPGWAARLGEDHCIDLKVLGDISDSALTREVAFEMQASGLPNSFVPGRNLIFLTLASALAYRRGAQALVTGVCETDFSGYPDCRDDTMKALQVALSLGLDRRLRIDTPLMWLDKAETWALAQALGAAHDARRGLPAQDGGEALVALIVEHTHTCYRGERGQRHPWGYGCGECPACVLRARGWAQWRSGLDAAAAARSGQG